MTVAELKKIAQKYAAHCCRETDYEGDIVERNMDLHICADEVAMPLLEWLSKDYCIVPKNKLQLEYKKSYSAAFDNTTCLDRQYARGRYQVLRAIFGREIFREDKK